MNNQYRKKYVASSTGTLETTNQPEGTMQFRPTTNQIAQAARLAFQLLLSDPNDGRQLTFSGELERDQDGHITFQAGNEASGRKWNITIKFELVDD